MQTDQNLLSVIILTCNEEVNLPYALKSLASLNVDIYIVDSGSQDKTLEIAREYNCKISTHPFDNHASQINRALEALPIKTPWVMRLDADERLSPELINELKQILSDQNNTHTGYLVKRRVYFWGKWIRFGGYYPVWLLRLWRHGDAVCESSHMDEHMILKHGTAGKLQNDIIDENRKGLSFWTSKHNHYADNEVRDILKNDQEHRHLTGQSARKRRLKKQVYGRSPLFLRAFLYWFMRYILLLGFLDGRAGLVFHFLQGFWYRFLIDAKFHEHQMQIKDE